VKNEKKEQQAMATESLETVDLDRVCGGFDAGRCFDDVWPWAAGGAVAGSPGGPKGMALGALGGGGAAVLASPNCGDGTRSPATMIRESLTPSSSQTPAQEPLSIPTGVP
jgi:hypothetical protein